MSVPGILVNIYTYNFGMAAEDSKDILKNVDWKTLGGAVTTESSKPIVKKRLPKKIRQVPDCYFLPRRSWPSALAIYGAVCAAGVGAGMLLEVWIAGARSNAHLIFVPQDCIWES
jgi:hypothetical protein